MNHAAASLLECRGMHCAKALTLGPRSAIGIAAGAATVTAWRQEPQSGASNHLDSLGLPGFTLIALIRPLQRPSKMASSTLIYYDLLNAQRDSAP
jgi:hypothetical protein